MRQSTDTQGDPGPGHCRPVVARSGGVLWPFRDSGAKRHWLAYLRRSLLLRLASAAACLAGTVVMVDILVAIPYLSENPKNRIRSGLASLPQTTGSSGIAVDLSHGGDRSGHRGSQTSSLAFISSCGPLMNHDES